MKVDVLCSDPKHPVMEPLALWADQKAHIVTLVSKTRQLTGGDVLFLVSCSEILRDVVRDMYGHCIVLHASDLPQGRGWSPYIWAILDGAEKVCVSALNAEDRVDTGAIWAKRWFDVRPDDLFADINRKLFATEVRLMDDVLEKIASDQTPVPQQDVDATYWPKRTPAESELDPDASLTESFDKLRVADPDRYPAFFRHRGSVYKLMIERLDDENDQD
ncbi:MAG: formyltransferase family protein [Pseudomonadota bacterium]